MFYYFFPKQRSDAIAMVQTVGGRQKGTPNVMITPLTLFNKGICCFGFVDQLYMYPRCEYNWILILKIRAKNTHYLFQMNLDPKDNFSKSQTYNFTLKIQ